jgi:hypothetical protein
MKKTISLLTILTLASSAFGQEISTEKMPVLENQTVQGLRIGLSRPSLKADIKATGYGVTVTNSSNLNDTMGFSVGYAHFPLQQLGWSSNLSYLEIKGDNSNVGISKLDGNLGTAFNKTINLKGGFNISKFTSGDNSNAFQASVGLQASLGVQFTPNLGLDIGYLVMNQTGHLNDITVELSESGPEISLTGTF